MIAFIATPIGNLADLTPRALEAFRNADIIACEDTRRTWQLLTAFDIPRPLMISYRQGNELRAGEQILEYHRQGKNICVCSDGGYPGISDPGYRLANRLAQEGITYTVLPGASAVDLALLHSGLPTSSYTFKGFPPRKPGALAKFFLAERDLPHTMIVYESPFRLGKTLQAALDNLGNRQAAICFELTKLHEHIHRGLLQELVETYRTKSVKGEIAIVIAGNNPKFATSDEQE